MSYDLLEKVAVMNIPKHSSIVVCPTGKKVTVRRKRHYIYSFLVAIL